MTWRGRTFREDFTLDDGRKVVVEWAWDIDHPVVWEIFDAETGASVAEMNPDESERFDEQVFALDPFPPHDDGPWGDE